MKSMTRKLLLAGTTLLLCLHANTIFADPEAVAEPEKINLRAVQKKAVAVKPSRLTTSQADKLFATDRITAPGEPSGYVCETNNHFTSCECKGALDCFNLAQSGKCDGEGSTWWQDLNDPSIGGCDFNDP